MRAILLINTDFSKAFDKISHNLRCKKLLEHGFDSTIYEWTKEFLKDREQRVILEDECSYWVNIKSEVPHGSVMGLLLFILFINDLP